MSPIADPAGLEARFRTVFAHLGAVTAYARRRGCPDPEAVAAETMTIAWRRLADVPRDDARPWLYATARNLAYAQARSVGRMSSVDPDRLEDLAGARDPAMIAGDVDVDVKKALVALSPADREALLLVAWEELTPAQAAVSLGISAVAFRVRLHRARRRCQVLLEVSPPLSNKPDLTQTTIDMEPS